MSIKAWAYLGILVALLGGMKWAYSAIYDAGYNAATLEQDRLIQESKDAAIAKEREIWQRLVDEAEAQVVVEERIVEVIREVEVEIPQVVERIVEIAPDCADLGPEFAGLLTQQALSGAGSADPDIPAEPD